MLQRHEHEALPPSGDPTMESPAGTIDCHGGTSMRARAEALPPPMAERRRLQGRQPLRVKHALLAPRKRFPQIPVETPPLRVTPPLLILAPRRTLADGIGQPLVRITCLHQLAQPWLTVKRTAGLLLRSLVLHSFAVLGVVSVVVVQMDGHARAPLGNQVADQTRIDFGLEAALEVKTSEELDVLLVGAAGPVLAHTWRVVLGNLAAAIAGHEVVVVAAVAANVDRTRLQMKVKWVAAIVVMTEVGDVEGCAVSEVKADRRTKTYRQTTSK